MPGKKNISMQPILELLKQSNRIEKNILCLYYFEKLSVSDIAIALKRDKQVVQKALEKILMKMSVQMSKKNSLTRKTSQT